MTKTQMMFFLKLVLIASLQHGSLGYQPSNIYGFQAKNIKGEMVNLSIFRGKVMLIVNVASECGYTDNHYKELNELQHIFSDGSFVILAFPCNQFGNQEPKRNSAIERFVTQTYDINFPLFSKIQVIGENAHPLFKWLKTANGEEPHWNFCKYLIDRQGRVAKFESQTISPLSMIGDIEKLLIYGTLDVDTKKTDESNRDEL